MLKFNFLKKGDEIISFNDQILSICNLTSRIQNIEKA